MSEILFSKYKEFMEHGDNESILILKGHLVIEELLTSILKAVTGGDKEVESARLSFHQKRLLAKATAGRNREDGAWKIMETINSLRNDIGHNLEPKKSEELINKLKDQLKGRDSEAYSLIPNPNNNEQVISHVISFCIGFLEAYLREKHA